MPPDYACTLCKSTFSKRMGTGRIIVIACYLLLGVLFLIASVATAGSLVFLLFLVLGLILIFGASRRISGKPVCPACRSAATVPIMSPAGLAIAAEGKAKAKTLRRPLAVKGATSSAEADRVAQEDAERFRASR